MFEIREKDGAGRIGVLTTSRGKVNTPTLLPVVNPNRQILSIDDLIRSGTEFLITNAYILFRTQRNEAIKFGIHDLIGFQGPIMTDSGAFQLMEYGYVDVTNKEICSFQEDIGVDFGIPLDQPLAGGTYEQYQEALNNTMEKVKESIEIRKLKKINWVGPVQGGPFPDLVTQASQKMSTFPFDIYALGSVVPLMEQYQFEIVVKMILAAKSSLPCSKPLHLFGAGHPMFLSMAVLCGADLFDSAAYALYARSGRYLTSMGTLHLKEMNHFPCACKICLEHSPSELLSCDQEEKEKLLAQHNLYVSFEEINTIKQAIYDGRLLNLVHSRAVSHPYLMQAYRAILNPKYYSLFEIYEVIRKRRSLFLPNEELLYQPLIIRTISRLKERFFAWGRILRVVENNTIPSDEIEDQMVIFSPVFGLIPFELSQTFPFYQSIIGITNHDIGKRKAVEFLNVHGPLFEEVIVDPTLNIKISELQTNNKKMKDTALNQDHITFRAMVDFQYGKNAGIKIKTSFKELSRKTNVLRRFVDENSELLATVRAKDFFLIPSLFLAQKIHIGLPFPQMRVVVNAEAEPFVKKGRNVFNKFVTQSDPNIRVGEEVLVVNEEDEFLGSGKALLGNIEMMDFSRGVAVKTRHGIGNS